MPWLERTSKPVPIYLRLAIEFAERGLQLTLPQLRVVSLDAPNSLDCHASRKDREWFRIHPKRRHHLRASFSGEYDRLPTGTLLPPPLWIWVVAIDQDHTARIPVWRGPCPFSIEPTTDSAVAAIVILCFEKAGVDDAEITAWAHRVFAAPPTWER